jgi:phosphoglucosamine mutase
MASTGRELRELRTVMTEYPQVLQNVPVANRAALDGATAVWDAVAEAQAELADRGRILVRASGTEPLVRVMVEAADADTASGVASSLTEVVRRELG